MCQGTRDAVGHGFPRLAEDALSSSGANAPLERCRGPETAAAGSGPPSAEGKRDYLSFYQRATRLDIKSFDHGSDLQLQAASGGSGA